MRGPFRLRVDAWRARLTRTRACGPPAKRSWRARSGCELGRRAPRLGDRRDPSQLRVNAYRVLLTRGRDGAVVFIPPLA